MRIALGVAGGIAAYKAAEIVRGLDQAGAEVQVILTTHATAFVTPLTLQTLSRRKVLVHGHDLESERTIRHIDLTHWIDALLVAPATANVLAKLARGVADDLLSTFYTAVTVPVVLAPAMNTRMWLHPATQDNVRVLRSRGVRILDPEAGWLAEGEEGVGRMCDPARIVHAALDAARRSRQLEGRTVVVTAGPTREAIDPVRYVTNRSSGKMGYAVAAAAARRGARVVLISGPVDVPPPYGVERIQVETSVEMRRAVLERRDGAEAVFMVAAVADYVPVAAQTKIKKTGAELVLRLAEGPDILAELGSDRRERVLVGFAAETNDLVVHARAKLERKGVDFIVANDVSRRDVGFESDDNEVTILGRGGEMWQLGRASKAEIADSILDRVLGAVPAAEPA